MSRRAFIEVKKRADLRGKSQAIVGLLQRLITKKPFFRSIFLLKVAVYDACRVSLKHFLLRKQICQQNQIQLDPPSA